jgi:hypothetical protein
MDISSSAAPPAPLPNSNSILDYNFVVTTFNLDTHSMEVLFEGFLSVDTSKGVTQQNIVTITTDNYDRNGSPTDNLLVDSNTVDKPDQQPFTDIFDYTNENNFFPKNGVLIDMTNYDRATVEKYLRGSDVEGRYLKTIRLFTDSNNSLDLYMQPVSDAGDNPIFANGIAVYLSPIVSRKVKKTRSTFPNIQYVEKEDTISFVNSLTPTAREILGKSTFYYTLPEIPIRRVRKDKILPKNIPRKNNYFPLVMGLGAGLGVVSFLYEINKRGKGEKKN